MLTSAAPPSALAPFAAPSLDPLGAGRVAVLSRLGLVGGLWPARAACSKRDTVLWRTDNYT